MKTKNDIERYCCLCWMVPKEASALALISPPLETFQDQNRVECLFAFLKPPKRREPWKNTSWYIVHCLVGRQLKILSRTFPKIVLKYRLRMTKLAPSVLSKKNFFDGAGNSKNIS